MTRGPAVSVGAQRDGASARGAERTEGASWTAGPNAGKGGDARPTGRDWAAGEREIGPREGKGAGRVGLSARREETGRGTRGWGEALTVGPAGRIRVGIASLVCGPSWSGGEGARAMLMLALASWDHRAEGERVFADCWRGACLGESACGIGPTWAAEERV